MPSSRRTCGGANIRGRIWNPPLQMAARPEATEKRRSPLPWKTPVGADSISARFAAARGSAGGACPSPANRGERPTKRDGPDHPGNRRAGCPHPAGPCGGANVRGRIWNPPLQTAARPEATGKRRSPLPWQTLTGPLVKGGESGDRGSTSLRKAAFFKRKPGVRQSLRHGLRPCHLPLTREAKPPHPRGQPQTRVAARPRRAGCLHPGGAGGRFLAFLRKSGAVV